MPTSRNNSSSTSASARKKANLSDVSSSDVTDLDEKLDQINKVLLTLMTRDDMVQQMNKFREEIRLENKEIIERLEGRVFDLEAENEDLKETIVKLEKQVIETEERQEELYHLHNDLEQQGRKNSIRIIGIQDVSRNETVEECVSKVVKFVNDDLKVNIRSEDIDIAHRLGPFMNHKPRAIICKFVNRRKKIQVLQARKVLKNSGKHVFEDLTRQNQRTLSQAYQLDCVEHSWSVDGKLYVKLKNGKKRRLSRETKLTESFLLTDANFI